jgi:nitrate/TMAO reductase-like tetraheme cytochrome c subunit
MREALTVERILDQKRQSLPLHLGTPAAANSTHFQIQVSAIRSACPIAHLPAHAVVEAAMHRAQVPQYVFCVSCESDDPRLRVREATVHHRAGTKASESVCVGQPAWLGPWQIMPDFSSR